MQCVLVTGGAGYIGSHVCKNLSQRGILPVTLDNLSTGHEWAVKWGPLIKGSIADDDTVRKTLRDYNITAAVHMASLAYVGDSVVDPGRYWRENVGGSAALLDSLRLEGVLKVVFSSSCAVYGVPQTLPIVETMHKQPVNPYGHTKLAIETMLADFERAYSMRHVCLRYFNAAGADPDGEIGEDHSPEPHLVPNVLAAATGQRPGVDILGEDYPTADGTSVRDFVHVADLATAHGAAVERLIGGGSSIAVNLGTGTGLSVLEIVSAAERITGRPIARQMRPRRMGDPPELVADAKLARDTLGFEPRYSGIDDILATAWAWQLAHFPVS